MLHGGSQAGPADKFCVLADEAILEAFPLYSCCFAAAPVGRLDFTFLRGRVWLRQGHGLEPELDATASWSVR